jgi:integrase
MQSFQVFQPYILTLEQILNLTAAASSLLPSGSLRPHTYRTLLGLLYSTGIRIGEALALNLEDFREAEERLYIAQGKFRKARWVPLSPSACRALSRYLALRLLRDPQSPDSPLFLNERKRHFAYVTVCKTFGRLLKQCDIPHDKRRGPRLHSLRHTFAVHRLLAWYRDGQDINARLPLLATYMGHVNIESTRVYLRPTAELLGEVSDRFRRHYLEHIHPQGGNS